MALKRRERQAQRDVRPAAGRKPRLGLFVRASLFDYLLVLIVSAALVYTVSYGFNSAPQLRGDVALVSASCALLLVPLYVGAWSRRAMLPAGIAYAVFAAGVVAFVSALSASPQPLFVDGQVNDVEDNYAVFGMVAVVVPLVVYLLSRRTWGVAVLFFLGVVACGAIQFLYRDWIDDQPGTVAALAAYVGMGALFMMQGYRTGVLRSRIVKRTSFAAAFAFGIAGALACMGVGVLVFYTVVSGLGLTTVNAKPFEDYFKRPVVEYDGSYEQQPVYDPNLGTSNLSDEVDETNDDESGAESERESQEGGGGFSLVNTIAQALNMDDWQEQFQSVIPPVPLPVRVLLAFVPLAVLGLIVYLRYRQRFKRLEHVETYAYPERVAMLYNFFMRGFSRLGVDRPNMSTPIEFAVSSANELSGFMRNPSQADFLGVTLIYQRAVYGARNVSEEDYRYVRDYYLSFFKNAHERMGHLRWALRGFWRI